MNIFIGIKLIKAYDEIDKLYLFKMNTDMVVDDISHNLMKNIIYENSIPDISVHYRDTILNLVKDGKKLFYRIDFPYCEQCVYPVIDSLNSYAQKVGYNKVVLLSSFPVGDYGNDFKEHMRKYKLHVINIPDLDFCFQTKDLIGTYLFLMNHEMSLDKLFFCGKNNHFLLKDYFESIHFED